MSDSKSLLQFGSLGRMAQWTVGCFLFAAIFFGVRLPAQAASYRVKESDCKGFQKKDGKWIPVPQIPWKAGDSVPGDPVPGRSDQLLIRIGTDLFAVPARCLTLKSSMQERDAALGGGSVIVSSSVRSHWHLEVGVLGWQETLSLKTPDDRTYALRSSSFGGDFGVAHRWALSPAVEVQTAAFLLYANSEAGETSSSPISEIDYLVTGATVVGGLIEPSILWNAGSKDLFLGVGIPLLIRSGDWREPAGGYELSPLLGFLPGVNLVGRLSRGDWFVTSRFGILGALENLIWNVGLGYQW